MNNPFLAALRVNDKPWQDQAECIGFGEVMYPESGHGPDPRDMYSEAKSFCRGCPVLEQCLRYAMQADERFGVWGGLTPDERRQLRGAA